MGYDSYLFQKGLGIIVMKELKKYQKIALITLCTLASVSFLYVYYHICNDSYDFNMFLRTLFTVAISFTAYFFITKFHAFFEKHYIKIVAAFLGIMLILQIIFGYFLEITPQWDFENIYKGAISWAETGTFPNPSDYFFYFPNNLGGMWGLSIIFRIAGLFQIQNYSMAATVVNALLNVTMMLLCFCICRKLASLKTAIFVLFIFYGKPAFLFWSRCILHGCFDDDLPRPVLLSVPEAAGDRRPEMADPLSYSNGTDRLDWHDH